MCGRKRPNEAALISIARWSSLQLQGRSQRAERDHTAVLPRGSHREREQRAQREPDHDRARIRGQRLVHLALDRRAPRVPRRARERRGSVSVPRQQWRSNGDCVETASINGPVSKASP